MSIHSTTKPFRANRVWFLLDKYGLVLLVVFTFIAFIFAWIETYVGKASTNNSLFNAFMDTVNSDSSESLGWSRIMHFFLSATIAWGAVRAYLTTAGHKFSYFMAKYLLSKHTIIIAGRLTKNTNLETDLSSNKYKTLPDKSALAIDLAITLARNRQSVVLCNPVITDQDLSRLWDVGVNVIKSDYSMAEVLDATGGGRASRLIAMRDDYLENIVLVRNALSPTLENEELSCICMIEPHSMKRLVRLEDYFKKDAMFRLREFNESELVARGLILNHPPDKAVAQKNIQVHQDKNNIWAYNLHFNEALPTLLLNSHHDTVKPNQGYTFEPFSPFEHQGKIYGLGSNDAGASVVSLLATFLYFYDQASLPYNMVYVASAEEEISGQHGIEMVLPQLKNVAFGIVGEPTQMEMAIAERGLLVLDIVTTGKAGHAARNEGDNAITKMLPVLQWFNEYQFSKVSDLLGPVKMTVSVIETDNKHHNVVPASCKIVVDIRVNELYSFQEILDTIQQNIQAIQQNIQVTVTPRSTRLKSSSIALDHPIVKAGIALGKGYYGSPTSSDKALMPFPALKMGPGDSARSHTADEYVYINEIKEGIVTYIQLLEKLFII